MNDPRYVRIREQIRTGDCILWKSRGLLPWLIQRRSEYSHASLVVRLDEYAGLRQRVFLVEALAHGLTLTLLSARLESTRGEAWLFHPEGLGQAEEDRLRESALLNCAKGVGYDYGGALANLFGRVSMDAQRYFCSEHVWHEWGRAGVLTFATLTPRGAESRARGLAPRPGDIPRWIYGTCTQLARGSVP